MVTRVLKYIEGASRHGFLYQNHLHNAIEGLLNVDYNGDLTNRGFTTCYCVFVKGNLVSWKSKNQNVVLQVKF